MGPSAAWYVFLTYWPESDDANSLIDGPALRATAIMTYATYLYNSGNTTYVTDTLWPIIELDLNYVAEYWNESTSVSPLPGQCVFQPDT